MMKILTLTALKLAVLLTLALTIASCCVCKKGQPTVIVRDSIRVEYRDRIVRDTINYEIPVEIEKVITRDTASHLENRLAASDAIVSNGFLSHSLRTKAQTIYIPVETHVTDTLIIQKEAEIRTETIEVEKPLTWWQRFRIGAFWWLVAIGLVGWRREIIAAVKYIIKLFTKI